jgi:hypothetical protein
VGRYTGVVIGRAMSKRTPSGSITSSITSILPTPCSNTQNKSGLQGLHTTITDWRTIVPKAGTAVTTAGHMMSVCVHAWGHSTWQPHRKRQNVCNC